MSEQKQQTEAADGQSRLTDGLCMEIPPGWNFEPLYKRCPNCGCDLNKEFVNARNDKDETQNKKNDAKRTGTAWVPSKHATGAMRTGANQCGLQRMVDPLAEANPEKTKRNKSGWHYRKSLEKTRARKKEDEETYDHNHLVPVIKRNFRERIIQWLFRAVA
jgi:hypothetical protein